MLFASFAGFVRMLGFVCVFGIQTGEADSSESV